ncbi:threonine aldolase family protein [Polymorphobacter fuscus]|uniref:Low specificity L-threonine aldolase n=1 Tax=Sandarakinorhabdus fusca TaxID=1439888 RepID=A0A7C9KIV8_9SPHN|nr:beta-eliminating lyase-related protein [Polymorphobacter fuscus]KAB7646370.1 low specificity L-threonine aldolase [Polymorphobacter fuscus]MQT17599.1 low specificity L-threonine aldolase [Polymorphobacter fuscus]NJC09858.1 threonine aldolase [Polymorphobacter fuscus]
MFFLSDNAASPCPEVLDAVVAAAPAAAAGYDGDAVSAQLDAEFGALFGRACTVLPVGTGTAANALALAAMVPPFGAVVCHSEAHIHVDECGAPEFFTGGAKLLLVPGGDGRLTASGIDTALAGHRGDVHQVQARALSLTQATEAGTVYAPDALAALGDHARAKGWRVHLDGARFANAVAHLGCAPGDISWRAGVDILSFGMIKNGGMTAEALVVFAPELVAELRFRRKRAGQMPSKGRFQAAQLLAMVRDDVWLRNARAANAGAAQLAAAAAGRLLYPVEANEVFVQLRPGEPERLRAQGFSFYDWGAAGSNEARFVVAWDTPPGDVAALAAALG